MYMIQVYKKVCYVVLIFVSFIKKENCVFLSWLLDYSRATLGLSPKGSSRHQCSPPPAFRWCVFFLIPFLGGGVGGVLKGKSSLF